MYNNLINERAKYSHLTKNTIDIVQGYFDYMSNNFHAMTLDNFLDYLESIVPRYSDAVRAKSLVSGILTKDFRERKEEWHRDSIFFELLDVCDLEKEAEQYISYKDWLQYEEEMHRFFVEKKLYERTVAYYFTIHVFTWHGMGRKELTQLDLDRDINISDDGIIEVESHDIKFKNEALAFILDTEARDVEGYLENIKNYGKLRKAYINNLGRENEKPYCMTLHQLYMSGVLYRASKMDYPDFGINQEAMIVYYKHILKILYKN